MFALIVLSTVLLSINMLGKSYSYNVGDIARQSIRVPWEIVYPVQFETDQERRFASESVPPLFDKDHYILSEKTKLANILFSNIQSVAASMPAPQKDDTQAQLKIAMDMLPEQLKYDKRIISAIISYDRNEDLRKSIVTILNDLYEKGILDEGLDLSRFAPGSMVTVRSQTDETTFVEEKRRIEDLYSAESLRNSLSYICSRYTADYPKDQQWAVYVVVKSLVRPNVRLNEEETKRRMSDASTHVKPIMGILKKGQVIVREGDSITIDMHRKIGVINKYTQTINLNYVIGIFLFQILFLFIMVFFLADYYQTIVPDTKAPFVMFLLLAVFFIVAFLVNRSIMDQDTGVFFILLLPVPFITMMMSIIYTIPLALITGAIAVFFSTSINGGDHASMGLALSSLFLGIFSTRGLEKRTDFLKSGLMIGLVNALVVVFLGLMEKRTGQFIITNVQIATAAGLINAIGVVGLFPVFEHFFGLTTIFRLHELSDLNAPLFKKMLIRAPGTYNHSLMVANMAEAACKEIGADCLLARVGGYYHDIGKIENAQIYIENKSNPTASLDLSAQEYSRLIISHVEKGVELAKKNLIPEDIISFIREHHGDTMMTFFYHQALEKAQAAGSAESVHRSDFQYPGPKPHTRETAIVMLADAIEAASRSVQDPTYVKLETMVKKIVYNKLNEGDLEKSDLTMQDLTKIQRAFLRILNGIFHTRLEYPEKDEIKRLEEKVKPNDNG
jgi:putative nucleotidyltransferase with HDIG domain